MFNVSLVLGISVYACKYPLILKDRDRGEEIRIPSICLIVVLFTVDNRRKKKSMKDRRKSALHLIFSKMYFNSKWVEREKKVQSHAFTCAHRMQCKTYRRNNKVTTRYTCINSTQHFNFGPCNSINPNSMMFSVEKWSICVFI